MNSGNEMDNSSFSGLEFKDVSAIVASIMDYQNRAINRLDKDRIREGRKELSRFATSYLKKIEYGIPESAKKGILERIRLLEESDPSDTIVIMTAHQPNLFAYSGILRKIALLKAIEAQLRSRSNVKNIVCFYGFADHDFIHNKWVRSAEMPAPLKRDGIFRFSISVPNKDIYMPTNRMEKPSIEKLRQWKTQVEGWISENCALAIKHAKSEGIEIQGKGISSIAKGNFDSFWDYVENAHKHAETLAEFSSFLFATIANSVLDTPIVFANFSDCYTTFGKEYELLLSNFNEYSETIEKSEKHLRSIGVESGLVEDISSLLPVWIKCECGSKYRIRASGSGRFTGTCMHCDRTVEYGMEGIMELAKKRPEMLEPRSISMPLAFSSAIGMSCYIGGKGGIGYLMDSREVAKKLNIPLPPVTFWGVSDNYVSIGSLAASWEIKKAIDQYGLEIDNKTDLPQNPKEAAVAVAEVLNRMMGTGKVEKNAKSERDRKLLENIPASLETPGCMVDYAVNVGIEQMYKQWIDFLVNGGSLQEQTRLRSMLPG